MRIAVLLAGRIRSWKIHYPLFQSHLIQGHDCDIFLSHSQELEEDLEGFKDLYHPVAVRNDLADFDPHLTKMMRRKFPSLFSSWKDYLDRMCRFLVNKHRVYRLLLDHVGKNPKIHYDFVVMYRTEICPQKKVPWDLLLTHARDHPHSLYIPSGDDYGGINDRMAIGSVRAMRYYCQLFAHLGPILQKTDRHVFGPELTLSYYLRQYRLGSIVRFFFPCELQR